MASSALEPTHSSAPVRAAALIPAGAARSAATSSACGQGSPATSTYESLTSVAVRLIVLSLAELTPANLFLAAFAAGAT